MTDPKNQQQYDMGYKAGCPKQKIYAGQVHLLSLVGQPAQASALRTFYANWRSWRMITTIVLCGSGSVPVTDDGVGAGPVGAAVVD